jgi:hypothetical protein
LWGKRLRKGYQANRDLFRDERSCGLDGLERAILIDKRERAEAREDFGALKRSSRLYRN